MGRKIGAKEVNQERREKILAMVDISVKQIDIANYYGMTKTTVSSIIRSERFEEQEETIGRKKKLSPRDTRSFLEVADKLRFKPVSRIASTYNQFAPILLSTRTVRRTLKENGIQNYTAMPKPYLSPKKYESASSMG